MVEFGESEIYTLVSHVLCTSGELSVWRGVFV